MNTGCSPYTPSHFLTVILLVLCASTPFCQAASTNGFEPLGPSSRRTALVISEIMYQPSDQWGTNNLEFIELWNSGFITEDLTGHKLSGEIDFTFPSGTTISPNQFLVIAKDPAAAESFYGVNCLGPYAGKLNNRGGTLLLLNELGARLLEIHYDNKWPWPAEPAGAGHSLVLSRPSYGENDPRAWSVSDAMRGSPGAVESIGAEPMRGVVINEILAHTDLPEVDYVELFNTTMAEINLSGAWLSDDPSTNRFRIPDGTTLPARGFVSFTGPQLGFALSAEGEAVFLVNSNRTRVLDAVQFDGQENGVALGRYPDGAPGFHRLASVTLNSSNSAPRFSPVVINEIMYHPISEDDNDEYVELFNHSDSAVNLSGWKLDDGISYTFPSNTVIQAGAYFVVAANRTQLFSKYPQLNPTNTFGNFSGKLSNSGERLVLEKPDEIVSTNHLGVPTTNIFYIAVNEVTYADGGRWGKWSDGGGSSLELIDPNADNRLAPNWADSDESSKASWTSIDVTDVLENGQASVNEGSSAYGVANRFEISLQGSGETLIDDVEFHNNGGVNTLANGNFSSGSSGWTFLGVLRNSFVENGVGSGGSAALHMNSTGRGDTGANKIAHALSSTAATGGANTGTMRAQLRWLKGSPYVLLRLRGNWMEVSQRLNTPNNCGTPGLSNSRRVANAGPAITETIHSPILPVAGQAVVVSARIFDPDGISAATLKYRIDPGTSYTSVAMHDDGTAGDALAGDGIYSATIPGRASGTMIAFYISATDQPGAGTQFPAEAPKREALVRWGEPVYPGVIGTYRLWVTAANVSFWSSREKNANDPIDATFVYGNQRVVYGVDTLYSGSPFHSPNYDSPLGFPCDYEVNFQPDERFLGSEPFVLSAYDVVSSNFFMNDDSAQVDLTGNWIARKLGQPFNYRRHVHVVVNGLHRGTIYDDAQQPNDEFVNEYFPEDDGELRKIESWFEFGDDAQSQGSVYTTITRYNKSTGDIDPKRYRWNWRPRATRNPNDWTAFTNLIAAVNDTSSPNYVDLVRTWMDVPNFLRPIVTHHICGSWDSYAYERGKNMFAYKPDDGGWRLLMWDIEIALGAGGKGTTDSIYNMFDPTLRAMILNTPAFNREYLRGFQEALDTALLPGAVDTALNERYATFQSLGIPLISPQFIKNYLLARRSYLISVLPTATFSVSNPGYQVVSGSNVLTLTGTAPLKVEEIFVNGKPYKITWTGTTSWKLSVPLESGTNVLNLSANDRWGNVISNAIGTVTANYSGITEAPEGFVVFNEIHFKPATPGGAFVELFNTHSNQMFDLSGWTINGLGYTFPAGSTLAPRSYLVLAEDPLVYSQTYGPYNVAFDSFPGSLDSDGETLTLLRPDSGTNQIVVNRVRYEAVAPWPVITNGASLQLIDSAQANSRVANWIAISGDGGFTPPALYGLLPLNASWNYMETSNLDGVAWSASNYNDSTWPSGPGVLAFENNPALTGLIETPLTDPRISTANVASGHAYYFRTGLNVTNDLAGYQVTATTYTDDGAVFYLNGTEIYRLRMDPGAVVNMTPANALPPGGDTTTPDSFVIPASAFVPGTNVLAVEVHQFSTTSSDVVFGLRLDAVFTNNAALTRQALFTPGGPNSLATNLPPFPPLWLNELQANNSTGPVDNFGQRDPWAEIFNTTATNVSLAGYYLSDNYSNLTRWAFPATATASNGFSVIWCDDQTNQSTAASVHAGVKLATGSGKLALSRLVNGSPQLVDYLTYSALPANWSYGDVPDAQPFYRREMFYPTPAAANNGASAPLTVFINEWMADNTRTLADPADSQFEDWLELYNPGTNVVDLGGYYLTDDLADKFKFQVPNNGQYIIPPGGYLLVWADNEEDQNATNRSDLHVDFALGKGGEAVGIFAADGTTIDAVTFGPQTNDVSEGRFPDGAAAVFTMPDPTPRAQNVVPNTPPSLTAINDCVITLGQSLQITAIAVDNDLPPQTLTYSLEDAPPGALIDALSGHISWNPTTAPATNNFVVVVTDDGTPSLTATQSFSVVTAPVPALSGYAFDGTSFEFNWNSFPGQQYQVEFKDELKGAAWYPIGGVLNGTGEMMSFSIVVDETSQRYFRLRILPPP